METVELVDLPRADPRGWRWWDHGPQVRARLHAGVDVVDGNVNDQNNLSKIIQVFQDPSPGLIILSTK